MSLTVEQQVKILEIKRKFDEKIQDFNSKYSKEDQAQFPNKRLCAQTVIDGGEDAYISALSNARGTTTMEMALYIMSKVEEFKVYYATEEVKRDVEIYNVTNNI